MKFYNREKVISRLNEIEKCSAVNAQFTYLQMIHLMIREDSTFLNEGKSMLIEEFGTEYATYFTILSAIARGENTRAKIEAVVNKECPIYA